jgi:branched-chain amino acid transport system substrate-binding protein
MPVAVVLVAGCRLLMGSLDECSRDADCVSRGAAFQCQDHLCVTDARCSVVGSTDKGALLFGLVIPLTTDGRTPDDNGPHWRDVMKLIADELNPPIQQGIGGRPLGIVVCDTQGSVDASRTIAARLASEGVPVIFSAGSSATLDMAAATVPARVLLMSGYAQSPEITTLNASPDGVRLVWRTIAPDQYVARVAAYQIATSPGGGDAGAPDGGSPPPRVAVLARNDSYGEGFYSLFSTRYPGAQAYFFEPSGNGSADPPVLARANNITPDVTVIWGFPDDIERLVGELDPAKYPALRKSTLYFNDQLLAPGVLAKLPPGSVDAAYAIAAAPADTSSPAFSWLAQEFQQKYGLDPAQSPSVAAYSDALMLASIAAAVANAKGDPTDGTHLAGVLEHVSAPSDAGVPLDPPHFTNAVSLLAQGQDINVQGASGRLDFDASTGEAPALVNVYQISNGTPRLVLPVDPTKIP